jgi:hypothetical protein
MAQSLKAKVPKWFELFSEVIALDITNPYLSKLNKNILPFFFKLENLNLPIRAKECVKKLKIDYVVELVQMRESEFIKMSNLGPITLDKIRKEIEKYGFYLGMHIKDWPTDNAEKGLISLEGSLNYSSPEKFKQHTKKIISSASATNLNDKLGFLSIRVDELDFSVRVSNCLEDLRVVYIRDLVCKSEAQLLGTRNFGRTSLSEVKDKLKKFRLQLGMNIADLTSDNKDSPARKKKQRPIDLWKNLKDTSNYIEDELLKFVSFPHGSYSAELIERNKIIVLAYFGLDGRGGKTLQSIGDKFGLTRERVRQICEKIKRQLEQRVQKQSPPLPVFNSTLEFVNAHIPDKADVIEAGLAKKGLSKWAFRLEGLLSVAEFLGYAKPFNIEKLNKRRFVVHLGKKKLTKLAVILSKKYVSSQGIANIDEIIAQFNSLTKQSVNKSFIISALNLSETFSWVDEPNGWFWLPALPRNRLINVIKKILSVSNSIDISELRSGLSRFHRLKGLAPPRRVLLEFCSQLEWCRVEGTTVIANPPLDWEKVLSGTTEWAMAAVLKEYGPVMSTKEFEDKCIALGRNENTFFQYISYSPIITKFSLGIYGLRGTKIHPGEIKSLKPQKIPAKVLVDFGWTSESNIWISYKLSRSIIKTGVINIPAAMKQYLQGEYSLTAADGTDIGKLKIEDSSAWSMSSFFRRRGGDPGDFSVLEFNLMSRNVKAYIGDAELLDEFRPDQ